MRSFLLVIALLLIAPASAQERAIAWQGRGADGQTLRFDPDHLQRPAILLFWATWCPYCKALMPHLQAIQDAAGKQRLDVYAIDIKDDGDPVAELRERHQTFTLVRDGDPIADQYGVKGTPSLLLVDRTGKVVYKRVGGDTPDKVEATLREKLGLKAASADNPSGKL
ncbi:MAG: TlpA family protein disulfide reductase [Lysobacterales bacterium]